MGKTNWKPEDYTDVDIRVLRTPRTCDGCVHANKDMRGERMNDCARCVESGWQVKKRFKKKRG